MITAAILAGGRARRLGGRSKGALPIGQLRIADRQLAVLRELTDRLIIVTDRREPYEALGLPIVADLVPGKGPLGGLYTAVLTSPTEHTLVVACDMPFLDARFLEHLVSRAAGVDVAVPRTPDGLQPLCAVYARTCAGAIRRCLDAGMLNLTGFLTDVRVCELPPEEIAPFDPANLLFANVNTPEDYAHAVEAMNRARIVPHAKERVKLES